jgi:hypothetical protein
MKWVEALKKYNEGKKYSIPKKGTAEYDAVRKLMGADAPAAAKADAKPEAMAAKPEAMAAKPKRAYKKRAAKGEVKEEVKAEVKEVEPKRMAKKAEGEKKPRAVRKGKAVVLQDVDDSNAAEARPKIGKAKAKAGSVPAGMIPEGATKMAVEHSKNPPAVLQSATNAHMPVVPAEAMVGLNTVKATKKHLREVQHPDLPTFIDKEKVVNSPAFSFQALRNKLGA